MSEEKKRVEELTKEWLKKFEPEYYKNLELGKSKPAYRELLNRFENRFYFFAGLALGTLFGILGNFLAAHWMELLRSIIPSQRDWISANLILFCIFLSAIIVCIFWIKKRLRSDRETINNAWLEIMTESLFKTKAPMPEELKQLLKNSEQKTEKTRTQEDNQE